MSSKKNYFEEAIVPVLNNLKSDLKEIEIEINDIIQILNPEQNFDEEGNRSLEFMTCTHLHNQEGWLKDQLLALNEMRVIYMFKNLEILLKLIATNVYDSTNSRNFYKWETINGFFNEKSIDLTELIGYREVNELRRLNNSLKHSHEINNEVRHISEFRDSEYIDCQKIESFLERVVDKVNLFQVGLIEEVRKYYSN